MNSSTGVDAGLQAGGAAEPPSQPFPPPTANSVEGPPSGHPEDLSPSAGAVAPPPGPWPQPGSGPPPWGPPPLGGWGTPPPHGPAAAADSPGLWSFLRKSIVAWVVAGVLALAVIGLSVALATSSTQPVRAVAPSGRLPFGAGPGLSGGSGVVGTVENVSNTSFTVMDRAGQTVTVDEQSSTTYASGGTASASSAVVKGASVVVQGTRSGNTVKASRVVVIPAGGFGGGFFG